MDLGILLLRGTIGLVMAAHGSQKVFGWFGGYGPDGTGKFMESMGFTPGRRHALAAGYVEIVAGLLLTLGLFAPLAAAMIASVMLVAAVLVHWEHGFFVTSSGYEYNLVLGVAALSVAFTGPGALSLDSALGIAVSGVLWGLGAAVVALLGAFGQLAQRQSSPAVTSGAGATAGSASAH